MSFQKFNKQDEPIMIRHRPIKSKLKAEFWGNGTIITLPDGSYVLPTIGGRLEISAN